MGGVDLLPILLVLVFVLHGTLRDLVDFVGAAGELGFQGGFCGEGGGEVEEVGLPLFGLGFQLQKELLVDFLGAVVVLASLLPLPIDNTELFLEIPQLLLHVIPPQIIDHLILFDPTHNMLHRLHLKPQLLQPPLLLRNNPLQVTRHIGRLFLPLPILPLCLLQLHKLLLHNLIVFFSFNPHTFHFIMFLTDIGEAFMGGAICEVFDWVGVDEEAGG